MQIKFTKIAEKLKEDKISSDPIIDRGIKLGYTMFSEALSEELLQHVSIKVQKLKKQNYPTYFATILVHYMVEDEEGKISELIGSTDLTTYETNQKQIDGKIVELWSSILKNVQQQDKDN